MSSAGRHGRRGTVSEGPGAVSDGRLDSVSDGRETVSDGRPASVSDGRPASVSDGRETVSDSRGAVPDGRNGAVSGSPRAAEAGAPEPEGSQIIVTEPVDTPSENFLVEEKLREMPALFARGLVYAALLLVAAVSMYAVLGRIDLVAQCRAVARPQAHLLRVLSDRDGYVARVFVLEGEQVEPGAALFLIRSKETITSTARVDELSHTIPLRERSFDLQLALLDDRLRQLENEHRNTLRIVTLNQQQNQFSLQSTESELQFWSQELEAVQPEFEGTRGLFEKQMVPLAEYNQVKNRLDRARTEIRKLELERDSALGRKRIIEEETAKESASYHDRRDIMEKELQNLLLQKQTELQNLRRELEVARSMLRVGGGSETVEAGDTASGDDTSGSFLSEPEDGLVMRAERAGTISELYVRNAGEYVNESAMLCTVVPADSPLYMDITVMNRDIGFIEDGSDIKYKFDAFPYTDYGILKGEVAAVSPTSVEDAEHRFVYRVKGTLEQGSFLIDGRRYPVRAGMTATAEIVTERRSILALLVRKLKT